MKYNLPLILIVVLFQSCTKKACQFPTYEFIIPVTITPAKENYRIGDTITITSSFSNQVPDRKTNRDYVLTDFNFYPTTSISQIDSIETDNAAIKEFDFLIDNVYNYSPFESSDGSISLIGDYFERDDEYFLSYKLVPRKKGLFYLSQFSAIIGLGDNQNFEGKCSKVDVNIIVEMNGRANNNIEFLRDSPDPFYNNWILIKPEERFYDFGGYCFRVVE